MKIASAQVAVSNDYQRKEASARRISNVKSTDQSAAAAATVKINQQQLQQSRLDVAKNMGVSKGKKSEAPVEDELPRHYDKSLLVMKMMLERMTGKKIDLFDAHRLREQMSSIETGNQGATGSAPGPSESPNDLIKVENYHYEKESNSLEFAGVINRQDGKQTRFAMAVEFSQEYESLSTTVMKREQLKDPLVISFSTQPVKLSGDKFEFDIDSDGSKDDIALLERGFGYLALDKNGDGVINDGSELFGGQSGNGFAELAYYDQNQDGYIDENDDIYQHLSIWIKNGNEDRQVSLSQKGVGAIALENVDSPFTLRDGDEKLGVIRKSGYYLNENGTAGLIQQLDYIV